MKALARRRKGHDGAHAAGARGALLTPPGPQRDDGPLRVVVLDTAALLAGLGPALGAGGARWVVPPAVRAEVAVGGATGRAAERAEAAGLLIEEPEAAALGIVEATARQSGDLVRLSPADLEVLALAETHRRRGAEVELWTDDFAVQNVAARLGVPVRPATGRAMREAVAWHLRCTGCGRWLDAAPPDGACAVCGSPIKRTRRAPPSR